MARRLHALIFGVTLCWLTGFGLVRAMAPPSPPEPVAIRQIDSLLSIANARYEAFTKVLHPIRYDSLLMTSLLDRAVARNHAVGQAFAYNRLGTLHRRRSQTDSALVYHDRALRLSRSRQDTLGQMVALNSRGIVYRHSQQVTEALDAHQAAIELGRAQPHPNGEIIRALAIGYDGKGRIYTILKQYDLAEQEYLNSMEQERLIGSTLGLAINRFNLGTINERRGHYTEALQEYRQALRLNEKIDSDIGRGINYIGMARVLTRQGSYGMALRYAREALPIVEARNDTYYTTTAELAYADVLIATKNYEQALRHIDRALELANNKEFIDEQATAYHLLSKLEERRGNHQLALKHFREATAIEARLLNENNQRYVSALSAQYDSELKEAEIARLAQENELVRERARRTRRNFIGLLGLLAFGGIILAVLYRQRKLVLQRDLVKLEQQRLASQMNPHFLFNALNSVKSYLISNEGGTAIDYLSKFARLMRRILSSTIDEEVPLAEEIENSQLYVAVENARFDGAIDFQVHLDPHIETSSLKVPPLMLQPFLENALWHGLRMKPGKKLLELEVKRRHPSGLEFVVRDNGIGRDAASADAEGRAFKRKSVGLDITRQRLRHFARRNGGSAHFIIHDLSLPDGSPDGTEVVIRLG